MKLVICMVNFHPQYNIVFIPQYSQTFEMFRKTKRSINLIILGPIVEWNTRSIRYGIELYPKFNILVQLLIEDFKCGNTFVYLRSTHLPQHFN